MFQFRRANLYRFELDWYEDEILRSSVQRLFGIVSMPSDTTIRRVLDQLSPADLRPFYQTVFRYVQRQKLLEQFRSPLDGGLLLAIDGTKGVSSPTIHCSSCLMKQHRPLDPDDPEEPERFTYYHQTLGAALVSSRCRTVLPLCPEPITGREAHGVQDSELKAASRWLPKFRREHPHLQVILLGDALYSNAPFIRRLTAANLKFMLRVKPSSRQRETAYQASHGERWVCGVHHSDRSYRLLRAQSLNQKNPDLKVKVLQERAANGKISEWITDREVAAAQVEEAILEARLRWRIENACFRTLKDSHGPDFEHNHGHGKQHLASIISLVAMWQQLVEQVCEHLCPWYQAALFGLLKKPRPKLHFWDKQMSVLTMFDIATWKQLYDLLVKPRQVLPVPET